MSPLEEERLRIKEFGESGLRIAFREDTVDEQAIGPWINQLGGSTPNPLGLRPEDTILDIGAHIGGFALPVSRMVPAGRVLAVEACRDSYDVLSRNVALNGLTNVETAHLALAGEAGRVRLYHHPSGNWGHTVTKAMGDGFEEVYAQTLAGFLQEHRVERCALAKLNCEGAEFPILMNAPAEALRTPDLMVVLYHTDLVGEPYDLESLESHLQAAGFEVERFPTSAIRGRLLARRTDEPRAGEAQRTAGAIRAALQTGVSS